MKIDHHRRTDPRSNPQRQHGENYAVYIYGEGSSFAFVQHTS